MDPERERQTGRQTDRQTDRQRHRERQSISRLQKQRLFCLFCLFVVVVVVVVVSIQLPSWIIGTQSFSSCERRQSLQIHEFKCNCYSVCF